MSKVFTVDIDTDGTLEINIKGYEAKSPELAAVVEAAAGKLSDRKWNPGQHAHMVEGRKVFHSH